MDPNLAATAVRCTFREGVGSWGHLSAFARAVLLVKCASRRIMRAVGGDVHLFRVARAQEWRAQRHLQETKSDTPGGISDIWHVLEDSTGRAARGGAADMPGSI